MARPRLFAALLVALAASGCAGPPDADEVEPAMRRAVAVVAGRAR